MNPTIHTIIVTHNAERWISPALESLEHSTVPTAPVVVDNASSDSTLALIDSACPRATVLKMPCNRGFAAANNEGLRHALARGAKYLFLLNQDARIEPDTIAHLVAALQSHADFGIISPLHLDYTGGAMDRAFLQYAQHHQTFISDGLLGKFRSIYDVPFVNAAAWLMRRSLLETVGGFDPVFFMYGEDNDYCARARHHGFKIGITPQARIFHFHGGSSGQSTSVKKRTTMLYTQAINMLKRPGRKFARNLPGFLITWARACLHAAIDGDGKEGAAVIASLLQVLPRAHQIKKHQELCRTQGPLWL
jgi:GT2 family glycosyltransferase